MEFIYTYLSILHTNWIFLALDFLKYFLVSFLLLISALSVGKFLRNKNIYLTYSAGLVAVLMGMIPFYNFWYFICFNFIGLILFTGGTWGKVATRKYKLKKIALAAFVFFLLFTGMKQLFNGYSQYYSMPILFSNDYIGTTEETFGSIMNSGTFSARVYLPKAGREVQALGYFSPSYIGKVVIVRALSLDIMYSFANIVMALTWGFFLNHHLPLQSKSSNIVNSMVVSFFLTFFFVIFW